jgi:hypothetical protein
MLCRGKINDFWDNLFTLFRLKHPHPKTTLMRKIFLASTLLCAIACQQPAPKTEVVEVKTTVSTATDSTRGTADWAGPDVDLLKKLLTSVEKADWDGLKNCFSDSARIYVNATSIDSASMSLMDAINKEKADRANWENVSYLSPILEVVTTPAGEKYGHLWATFSAKNKKSGKKVEVPMFASYLIKDGKLQWESVIYDTGKFQ